MRLFKILLMLFAISFFSSCASHKKVASTSTPKSGTTAKTEKYLSEKQPPVPAELHQIEEADVIVHELKKRNPNLNESTLSYIEEYNDIAILEMISYHIPASITLAQGILESESGNSRLSVKANNHFGIKCHSPWEGKKMHHDDDARQECFRKYDHPLSSFRDHSLFLYERSRYADLFTLDPKDYKGWAYGLKKAGYATDPKYPVKLIGLIETYELYKYDDFGKEFKYGGTVAEVSNEAYAEQDYIVVAKGDTLYSIAKKNNLTVDKLKWLNGLKSNEISIGQKIYLK